MLDLFPEWERIELQLLYVPTEFNSEMDMATAQKNQVTLATEKPDIYIFDQHHFDTFVKDETFVQLDELARDGMQGDERFLKKEIDGQEHIYGVDITDSQQFSGMAIESYEKIAVIRLNAYQEENAFEWLGAVLKALEDN